MYILLCLFYMKIKMPHKYDFSSRNKGYVIPEYVHSFHLFGAIKFKWCIYLAPFTLPLILYFSSCSDFLSRVALYSIEFCFPPRDQTCLIKYSRFVDKHSSYFFILFISISVALLSSQTRTASLLIELSSDFAPWNATIKKLDTSTAKDYTNIIKYDTI